MSHAVRGGSDVVTDHPFLTFVNTVSDDGKTRLENSFSDGAELCAQLSRAGLVIEPAMVDDLDLPALLAFRESAFATLSAYASKREPDRKDMEAVEACLKQALNNGVFQLDRDGFAIIPQRRRGLIDQLALLYFNLVNAPDFGRLKECQRCTKMFLDHGRGRGRRWCDMSVCGNRAKAESFRARKRGIAAQ